MTQSKNDRLRARREFESKVFLVFALRLMYRHYVRSPMINNWITKLSREVRADCKGRRKRIRGPLIRFGKKIIEAVFQNKTALASDLREGYTNDARHLVNDQTRAHSLNQYGYTERRAREALSKAEQAFGRNRPTEELPIMQDRTESEEDWREFEDSVLNDPEQAEAHTESDTDTWDTPFRRPSEEAVNAMLANACDDNGYSEDKFDNPSIADSIPVPSSAEARTEPHAPAQPAQVEQGYFPGFEPTTITTHKSARIRSRWAHLRATPENIPD